MPPTQATNKKGAPTQQSADAYAAQMKASRVAPYTWQDYKMPSDVDLIKAGVATNVLANNADRYGVFKALNTTRYPQRPLPLDERDSDVAMLHDLAHPTVAAGGVNAVPPLISDARPYPVQDWEIEYMKSKAAAEDYAAYQQWLSDKYDLNDMATRAWFKQIAPEYFSQKRELLKELMDRHAKYSLLRMAGPENEEDLRFEYAVESGRIPIPKGPFYNPLEWTINEMGAQPANMPDFLRAVEGLNKKAYQYGMFNPVKPRTAAQSGFGPNAVNNYDIVGDPDARSYGFPGQTPPTSYNWWNAFSGDALINNRNTAATTAIVARQGDMSKHGGFRPIIDAQGVPTVATQTMYNPMAVPPAYIANNQIDAVNQFGPGARASFPNKRLWGRAP